MTSGALLPGAPASLADRPVLTAGGTAFTVADIAQHARVGGREALAGSARAAEESFRRARGLLTADRLEEWLAAWAVEADDFRRWTEDAATGGSTATAWCTLLCSGALDAATAEVAAAAAAACELGEPPVTAARFDPSGWTERLVDERCAEDDLVAVVAGHRLDWTRLAFVEAETDRRGVAEEMRHQVLAGADLLTVAVGAGCSARAVDDTLDTLPPDLRASLSGARPGEVVGPVPSAATWTVVHVTRRTEPSLADDRTRTRAHAAVRHAVITAALARHVVA